jgi:hypothetical protein
MSNSSFKSYISKFYGTLYRIIPLITVEMEVRFMRNILKLPFVKLLHNEESIKKLRTNEIGLHFPTHVNSVKTFATL